jgi:hypothetical protein
MKPVRLVMGLLVVSFLLIQWALAERQSATQDQKTRIAIVGLDHDHVWELLKYIANEPQAELVGIADAHPYLVDKAKSQVSSSVKFYPDYIKMLDEANWKFCASVPNATSITPPKNLWRRMLWTLARCSAWPSRQESSSW